MCGAHLHGEAHTSQKSLDHVNLWCATPRRSFLCAARAARTSRAARVVCPSRGDIKEADKVGQGLPGQTFEAWRLDYTCRVLAISREWVTANALLILLLILTQCMHTPEEGLTEYVYDRTAMNHTPGATQK